MSNEAQKANNPSYSDTNEKAACNYLLLLLDELYQLHKNKKITSAKSIVQKALQAIIYTHYTQHSQPQDFESARAIIQKAQASAEKELQKHINQAEES